MTRFWMSWTEASPDYRPLSDPPGPEILGWWCSGEVGDGTHTICALVEAESVDAAQAAIDKDWPADHRAWRFRTIVEAGWLPGDRFPLKDWMGVRAHAARRARGGA